MWSQTLRPLLVLWDLTVTTGSSFSLLLSKCIKLKLLEISITGWVVALTCYISHSAKYRKMADFDPYWSRNPLPPPPVHRPKIWQFCFTALYSNSNSTMQISNLAVKIRPQVEMCHKRATTPFKVMQGHRFWYQWKADIQLNYHTSYVLHRFRDIADYLSNFAV